MGTSGLYTSSNSLGPFANFIQVNGIKIVSLGNIGGQDGVDKKFSLKTARVIQEILSNKGSNVDIALQNTLISSLSEKSTIQRVGVESMDSYRPSLSDEPGWDDLMDSTQNTDFIWQLNNVSGNSQATEVIEHVLHTVTRFGLPAVFNSEFDYESSRSLISRAFEEAKSNGVYSDEEYPAGGENDSDFQSMLKQEYLYCLIYANWGMIESHVDGGTLAPEWSNSHLDSQAIGRDNPLGQKIFDEYISKVIARPNQEILDLQFRDLGGGIELYTPDGLNLIGDDDISDSLNGTNGSDTLIGKSGNDVLVAIRGSDYLEGGSGNDELRAGNGRDIITGGAGGDTMYGGFGRNTFEDEADGAVDSLYFKSDQWAYNWVYDSAGNSANGEKADVIAGLDVIDKVYIQGVSTDQLSFGDTTHTFGDGQSVSGIGIFAQGVLEAIYTGGDLSVNQLQSMTSGIAI